MPKRKRKPSRPAPPVAEADQLTVEPDEEMEHASDAPGTMPVEPSLADSMDAVAPEEIEPEAPEHAGDMQESLRRLESERDEAAQARIRALADFSNYQRRAAENETRAAIAGAANVVRSLISVLDNFDLALSQDTSTLSIEQLVAGVQLVRDELSRALESHGVTVIDPEIGSEFDPNQHEAMLQEEAEGFEPNTIVDVYQPGYAMGDLVLRAAKVVIAAS